GRLASTRRALSRSAFGDGARSRQGSSVTVLVALHLFVVEIITVVFLPPRRVDHVLDRLLLELRFREADTPSNNRRLSREILVIVPDGQEMNNQKRLRSNFPVDPVWIVVLAGTGTVRRLGRSNLRRGQSSLLGAA